MPTIETSIDINVPVETAYDQWREFAKFPQFMEGVKQVKHFDTNLEWKAEIAGQGKEWEAEITDQTPDNHIAWPCQPGFITGGAVMFHPISDAMSKVLLQLEYIPQDNVENVGDELGPMSLHMQSELERFNHVVKRQKPRSIACHTGRFPSIHCSGIAGE